jgi:Mg-chelatase subunit ChlI
MAKAKFDIKSEATRPIYAYVGVTDLAVEAVRGRFNEVQTRVSDIDFEPKALRQQAVTLVNARVEAIANQAQARRAAIEARVAELQDRAKGTYTDLVERGETLVERIRKQESTQAAVKSGKTTSAKAKTTKTQASKGAGTTAKTAKSSAKRAAKTTTNTAKKQSTRPRSSVKATATAARNTGANATKATSQAAKKVGD